MSGRFRFRSLLGSALACSAFAPAAMGQTTTPPAPQPAQRGPAAPSAQPAPAAPAAPRPAPAPAPATAAFPPVPTAAAPAPAAPPPAAAAAQVVRKARVSFDADEPGAVLEADHADQGKVPWYVVCEAPCTRVVATNGTFRVSGPGFHASRPFMLPDDKNDARVTAEMESSSLAVPMVLTVIGGTIASAGLLTMVGGAVQEQEHHNGEKALVAGGIIGGVGAVIGGIGVVMLLVESQHTESRAHVAKPFEPRLDARGVVF